MFETNKKSAARWLGGMKGKKKAEHPLKKRVNDLVRSMEKKDKRRDDFIWCGSCGCWHYRGCHLHSRRPRIVTKDTKI